MALPTDALLRYKLDEKSGTSVASIGSNTTAATLVRDAVNTYTAGPLTGTIGQFLNGTSDFVTLPGISASLGDSASFCIWIKETVHPPTDALKTGFANFGPVISGGANHATWTDGKLYMSFGRATGNTTVSRVNTLDYAASNTTGWHHIAVTTTPGANGWKLYIDGVLSSQTTGLSGLYWDNDLWCIGKSYDGVATRYFNGAVSDFWLFDRAIDPTEVATIYADSLKEMLFHYKCDDTSSEDFQVTDSSGNLHHGTLNNYNPSTYTTSGPAGPDFKAFDFSSNSDFIDFQGAVTCASFALWLEIVDTGGSTLDLAYGEDGADDCGLGCRLDVDFILVWYKSGDDPFTLALVPGAAYHIGEIIHLAVVCDDVNDPGSAYVYVDGELVGSIDRATTYVHLAQLCSSAYFDGPFTGKVDDIRGYSYALTAEEVTDLYALRASSTVLNNTLQVGVGIGL